MCVCVCVVRLSVVRSDFHRLRERYGGPAVLAATAATAAVSLPFGRFAALRNAALAALAVGWLVRPSLVTGMLAASTEGVLSTQQTDWSQRGEQIVRQQAGSSRSSVHSAGSGNSRSGGADSVQ